MNELAQRWIEGLKRGKPDASLLRRLGEPEGDATETAIRRALSSESLAQPDDAWIYTLLVSARPRFGAEVLVRIAEAYRAATGEALDLGRFPRLPELLGASNFAARLLQRFPTWMAVLAGELPSAPTKTPAPDWTAIRVAKYQGLLAIAARDLAGRSFSESLTELSDLADGCLAAALERAAAECEVAPPSLLALGKLGGRELNFSSDVDLLFLYEAPEGAPDLERNHQVAQVVRRLKAGLEARGEEGFGYRVDLDLRPEGPPGALANSITAALHYYEVFGADWERQALLRLRHVAGPTGPSNAFEKEIEPFVYRRSIDTGALAAVREMKFRIESERRAAGRELEREIKEGPGGIRDVEFLVQALQMFFGGRDPSVRTGNVLEGLAALATSGCLPEAVADVLTRCYTWLRRAEHALQLEEERQVHRFPEAPEPQRQLARRMGYREPDAERARAALLDDWSAVRTEVRVQFDAILPEDPREA